MAKGKIKNKRSYFEFSLILFSILFTMRLGVIIVNSIITHEPKPQNNDTNPTYILPTDPNAAPTAGF